MSSPPKGGSNSSASVQEIPKSSKKKGTSSKKASASSTAEADGHPGPSTSVITPQPKKSNKKSNKENREESSGASSNSTPVAHNNNNQKEDKKQKSCCASVCCCFSCSWLRDFIRTRILGTRLTVHNQVKEKNNKMHTFASAADNYFNGNDSEAPPTVDEIRSWGQSFDMLMRCSAGRQIFRDFLRHEYSEENILFWQACEDLKRERNPEIVEEKARTIYEDYVSILSPKEVSLDSRVREIVNRNMMQPTANTFDEAQLQIYTLMHRDSYPRFVSSPIYRQMAQLTPPTPPTRRASVSVG